jgi:hypothetical protein
MNALHRLGTKVPFHFERSRGGGGDIGMNNSFYSKIGATNEDEDASSTDASRNGAVASKLSFQATSIPEPTYDAASSGGRK